MLVESARLRTFHNNEWPHNRNFVSIDAMAMSGLYFTGVRDNVKCAFCPVGIHKWEQNDDPITDHLKFNRNCCFLRDRKNTLNISDLSTEKKLQKYMSHLPEYGIDEIDTSSSNTK